MINTVSKIENNHLLNDGIINLLKSQNFKDSSDLFDESPSDPLIKWIFYISLIFK